MSNPGHTHLIVATALLGATLAMAMPAVAGVTINCGSKPVRLAFYDFGLFHFSEKNVSTGIDKDLVDELIKRSGCTFETQVMARARIWADLASGNLDMTVSGIQNAERDRFAWFAPYLVMKNYALVRLANDTSVQSADDFLKQTTLKFGVVRAFRHGTEQDQWLDQLRAQQRVEESPDVETIFRKLRDHRVNAIFSQPPVYRKNLQDLDMARKIAVQDWTPKEKGVPHGLVLAKSRFSDPEAAQWRTLIEEMRTDGSLKKIYLRYLPAAEADRLLDS
jgi:polar amino acid transport system substrate-binding protein